MTICICVTLQQGKIQILAPQFGYESGDGHERGVCSAGVTNRAAAQERNGLCRNLVGGDQEETDESVKAKVTIKTSTHSKRYPSPHPVCHLNLLPSIFCTN